MGRRRDEETSRNRTRRYDAGGYDSPHRGEQGYGRRDYRDDEGYYGDYGDRFEEDRYYRDRDREREYYWREREQRQETRRTGMMVIGGICIAVIALLGVMAVTGDDSSQTAQQAPQGQPAPQQPAQQPQAPAAPQQPDGASAEQVEGLRADLERQLAEIRQSINQLRLEIWSFFTSNQQGEQEGAP